MKKLLLLSCCFLIGCTENDLGTTALVAGAGYGLYRIHEISKKDNSSNYYYFNDDCRNYYQNFQGCCSYHGGVLGCYNYYVICNDDTISPSCTCSTYYCIVYK